MKNINAKESQNLRDIIINSIQDKKGQDILELNMTEIDEAVSDYFIICHGDSTTQVNAIANGVYKEVKDKLGSLPIGFEGKETSQWVVVDYFDVVVHIFYRETRNYYQLEELWSDAKVTEF